MAEFAAFPLWLDAYLLDTQELKTVEHGAYLLILFAMWRAGGFLPNNDAKLARCARLPLAKWMAMKPTMMEFLSVDGDQITQGRLQDEIEKARARSAKAAQSARAKYRKTNRSPSALAGPKDSSRSASISVSVSKEESSLRSESSSQPSAARLWWDEFWALFPNKVGKADAVKAFDKARKRVDRQTMLAGLQRYVDKTDDRPWCNPSTWLNQDRWADQPAQVARTGPTSTRKPTALDIGLKLVEDMENAERENAGAGNQPVAGQHRIGHG